MSTANVATTSGAYDRMLPRWKMIQALLGGTEALREAGEKYLPRYPAETVENWRLRRDKATLFNYFSRALADFAARPFQKDVTPAADAPDWMVSLCEDVDRRGNSLSVFAHRVFRDALANGLSYILVDAPRLPEGATLADQRTAGGPYLVHVPACNVIALRTAQVGSREAITHARILENHSVVEEDGLTERTVRRVRVLEPGKWTVFEEVAAGEWEQIEEGGFGHGQITMVCLCLGEPEGPGAVRPPLLDLAHLNIAHWQSASDQRHCLSVCRFPMLGASGVSPTELEKFVVGPNAMLATPDAQGKFYFVEMGGAAIAAGRQDLQDLEQQMAVMSTDLLVRRTGAGGTATEAALEAARGQSLLQTFALLLKDALEQAFVYASAYLPDAAPGSLDMDTDAPGMVAGEKDVDLLLKAFNSELLDRSAVIAELQRRGFLSDAVDASDTEERVQDQGPKLSGRVPDFESEAA